MRRVFRPEPARRRARDPARRRPRDAGASRPRRARARTRAWSRGAARRCRGSCSAAAELGWSGLEGLAGVPGNVGGGVAMNAGGRWGEMWDVVERVRVLDAGRRAATSSRARSARRGYRNGGLGGRDRRSAPCCGFERRRARRGARATRELPAREERVQPVTEWSSGCIFKNPDPELSGGRSAGKLIEDCGAKGLRARRRDRQRAARQLHRQPREGAGERRVRADRGRAQAGARALRRDPRDRGPRLARGSGAARHVTRGGAAPAAAVLGQPRPARRRGPFSGGAKPGLGRSGERTDKQPGRRNPPTSACQGSSPHPLLPIPLSVLPWNVSWSRAPAACYSFPLVPRTDPGGATPSRQVGRSARARGPGPAPGRGGPRDRRPAHARGVQGFGGSPGGGAVPRSRPCATRWRT